MFKHISVIRTKNNLSGHQIVDDDFTENVYGYMYFVNSIIYLYNLKKLNVAKNLYLYNKFLINGNNFINFRNCDASNFSAIEDPPQELNYKFYFPEVKKYYLLD